MKGFSSKISRFTQDLRTTMGWMLLDETAKEDCDRPFAMQLVEDGASLAVKDQGGCSALVFSATSGYDELARAMLVRDDKAREMDLESRYIARSLALEYNREAIANYISAADNFAAEARPFFAASLKVPSPGASNNRPDPSN